MNEVAFIARWESFDVVDKKSEGWGTDVGLRPVVEFHLASSILRRGVSPDYFP